MDVKDAELMPKIFAWMSQADAYEAWEVMFELVRDDPEEAWTLVLDMVALAPSRYALGSVAAGPLEDLLHGYGPQFIDRAVAAAAEDAQFHRCLAGVWALKGEIGARVAEALGKPAPPDRESELAGSIERSRAALITRWFHNHDNMWANQWLARLIDDDAPAGLHAVLLLAKTVAEEQPELLEAVLVHAFDRLVERNLREIRSAMAAEAKSNEIVRSWIDGRRTYGHIQPAWQALIDEYDRT